jgi:Transposase DDE domain
MNDRLIITSYVIIDDTMRSLNHRTHSLAKVSDAEVLTVAVVAAKYFHNNHERALWVLTQLGYLSRQLSTSRFNRRLHAIADWLPLLLETLGELFASGTLFIIDSMPLPVCRRTRARRNRKVRGRDYCGYCAAKREKFFGFRLHLVCTPAGVPISFAIVAGGYHDLTLVHELIFAVPEGACVFGDKGYNSALDEATIFDDTGVRLIPIRRKNMKPHDWADEYDLKQYRKSIETVNAQLEKMGTQHLHARTLSGFDLKVHASLFALACSNIN